jgi:hypothetical protein
VNEFDITKENIQSVPFLPINTDIAEQTLAEIASKGSKEVCDEMCNFIKEDPDLFNLFRLLNCITETDAANEVERIEMKNGFYFTINAIKKSFESKNFEDKNKNSLVILNKHFDKGILIAINRRMALSLDGYIEEKIKELREIDPVFVNFMLKTAPPDTEKEQRNKFIHGATEAYLMVYLAFKEHV